MNNIIDNIIKVFNDAGRTFCDFSLNMFVQVSVLIVVLLIIDILIRKRVRATFRYCIWMLVFIKLVLPPALSLPTGIGNFFGEYFIVSSADFEKKVQKINPEPATTQNATNSEIPVATEFSPQQVRDFQDISRADMPWVTETQEVSTAPQAIEPDITSANSITWQGGIFMVWLVGVLVLSVLLIQRIFFVKGLIAQSEPAKNRLLDILQECSAQLGIKRNIQMKLSHNASSPAVCGLFNPVILIPANLLSKISHEKFKAILIHELSHIKRNDLLVNCAQTILQILYFYNPLVWLANSIVRKIREQAVDEMVLVALGAEAKSYTNTLIDVAEMAFSRPALSLRLVGVVESKKALSERIKHILNRPFPKSAKLGFLGLFIIIITAAILLPMAKAGEKSVQDIVNEATVHMDNGEYHEAKDLLDLALERKPDFAEAWVGYGMNYIRLGDYHQAKTAYEKALTIFKERYQNSPNANNLIQQIFVLYLLNRDSEAKQLIDEGTQKYSQDYQFKMVSNYYFEGFKEFRLPKELENNEKYIATLPNGVTVELLGICEHPSEGKQWWKPDGSKGLEGDWPVSPLNTEQIEMVDSSRYLDVAWRCIGPDEPKIVNWFIDGNPCEYRKYTGETESVYVRTVQIDKGLEKGDISFDIGHGKYGDFLTGQGQIEAGTYIISDVFDGKFIRTTISKGNKDGKAAVKVAMDFDKLDVRIRAKDIYNNWHRGKFYDEWPGLFFQETYLFKDLPLNKFDYAVMETRGITKITFRNVSLKYGKNTEISTDIIDIPKEDNKEKPDIEVEEYKAGDFLLKGGNRAKAAELYSNLTRKYPDPVKSQSIQKFANMLAVMAQEDERFVKPQSIESLSMDEKINYYIYKLRDVAEQEISTPENCNVLRFIRTPDSAALALRRIGKPAVPALISLLEDMRPTRSVNCTMNGSGVLRYCDVALQVLEAICAQQFGDLNVSDGLKGTGIYLHNVKDEYKNQIISNINAWWENNKDKDETRWIRESLATTGISNYGYRIELAERLIEMEVGNSIEFFRSQLEAEPDNEWVNILLNKAIESANKIKESPLTANLPNGVTVELLGICEYPSEGKQWWKPDGTLLEQKPYDRLKITPIPTAKPNEKVYEFAFRLSNTLETTAISVEGEIIEHGGYAIGPEKNGNPVDDISSYVSYLPKDQKVTTITISSAVFKNVSLRPAVKTDVQIVTKNGLATEVTENSERNLNKNIEEQKDLQQMIDSAKPESTIIIPNGKYTQPVEITKPLILKGQSRKGCILEITDDKPAIFINTKSKGKVTLENMTIKWQLATSDQSKNPYAIAAKDSVVFIKNCSFEPLGNSKRSPEAVRSIGFSDMTIDTCRFEGFEYTVCFGEGSKGTIQNSLIMNSGHQGISLYEGAAVKIIGNVITGSKYHGVRSTGGTFDMKDNLIIKNDNRGVYLGNKSANGTIENNVIIGNGSGISGFSQSKVTIENNVIADDGYAGIDMRDSCKFSIRDNIIKGNERGLALFKESGKNNNEIFRNTFWQNKTETQDIDKHKDSIASDPLFNDAENGDFSLKPGPALEAKQGLENSEIFISLWKIWKNRADKNEPVTNITSEQSH